MAEAKGEELNPQLGLESASLLSRATYHFVEPLIRLGVAQQINEGTARGFLPSADAAERLAADWEGAYAAVGQQSPTAIPSAHVWLTYWRLYKWRMAVQMLWALGEVAARVGSPVLLRQLINWFVADGSCHGTDLACPAIGRGWMWAGLLASCGYAFAFVTHENFWTGMRMGFNMRLQAVAAVQAKVLRLNAAAVADVSPGKIVNLVSNDVRRLDDAALYWTFLVAGPLELIAAVLLIGSALNFAASFCGVALLLLMIPLQGALVRHIGRIRSSVVAETDERVRLTGEAIEGVLAAKMMGWESPLVAAIQRLRSAEAHHLRSMAQIRAINMALAFAITPLISMVTFSVASSFGVDLTVGNVFYTIALLSLQRVYISQFFVQGVEFFSELRVSMRRVAEFLHLPEPPDPAARQPAAGGGSAAPAAGAGTAVAASGVKPAAAAADGAGTAASGAAAGDGAGRDAEVAVAVNGVDFDWDAAAASHGAQHQQAKQQPTADGVSATRPGSAASSASAHITLKQLRFEVRRGQLLGIVGGVGSGKSSILAALLGELQPLPQHSSDSGGGGGSCCETQRQPQVLVQGRVAYCSQVPWIASGSIKENILFGRPHDAARYAAVLEACSLTDDIAALPAGDATELGERGINLSGGQKARVALARAAYSQADVQLLDDPLSAVDPRVGRALFARCIGPGGVMDGSTRLLVTHQRQYLPACDLVLVVAGGRIVHCGTVAELAARGVPQVITAHEAELDDGAYDSHGTGTASGSGAGAEGGGQGGRVDKLDSSGKEGGSSSEESDAESDWWNGEGSSLGDQHAAGQGGASWGRRLRDTLARLLSCRRPKAADRRLRRAHARRYLCHYQATKLSQREMRLQKALSQRELTLAKSGRLIVGEDRALGDVPWTVYWRYLRYMGLTSAAVVAVCLLGGQAVYTVGDYWLAQWASQTPENQSRPRWMWGYSIFAFTVLIISLFRAQLFFAASLRAATDMHSAMVQRVLRAPLSFFHTNPTGRVLNRFSRDQGAVDELLPSCLFDALSAFCMVLGALVLLAVAVPLILPVFIPLALAFLWLRRRYMEASRDVKRHEATTRSPIYSSLSATLKGLPIIRAYNAGARFRASFLADLINNGAWWFCWITTTRWLGFRLDVLVALLMTVAPLLMMALHKGVQAKLVGLALTRTMQLSGLLQWMIRQSAEVENHVTSIERMLAYTELEQEPPTVAEGGGKPPADWPQGGAIQYTKVTATYRRGLAPVLRGLSFTVQGGASCGVVGRTGSGKSTLLLALLRLIPVTGGTIMLDGVDTASLGVDALRRQVAVIPQDPVLFSGTLRSNLDPWGTLDDARLWEALREVQLGAAVSALGGLDAHMAEAGGNMSVGQSQLFALARALLQDASVLALDEATANVDRDTDALIQAALRAATAAGGSGPSAGSSGGVGDGGSSSGCRSRSGGSFRWRAGGRRRTLLVIAHRIDTIIDCDQLLVLSGGRLVESGAPGALARSGGVFARLVAAAQGAPDGRLQGPVA